MKKSIITKNIVIPAKAGIQTVLKILDSRFHGNDDQMRENSFLTACQGNRIHSLLLAPCCRTLIAFFMLFTSIAFAGDLSLQALIDEALLNSPEILSAKEAWKSSAYKIPQAKTLPDPEFMVQYQNEGWDRYTFGEMEGAQWMFSATQMFPFPGKLGIKKEMTRRDAEGFEANYNNVKLRVASKVKTAYYDLYFNHKSLEILNEKRGVLEKIESSALSRYSTGMASQQEVLMAQIEKSMLIEKEQMLGQSLKSGEAEINMILGRNIDTPLGKPSDIKQTAFAYSFEELQGKALNNSQELTVRGKMIKAGEAKVEMAKKEYYPDFNLTASVSKRKDPFEDMWSLGVGINIPLFYKKKQGLAVLEQKSALLQARHEYEEKKQAISFELKDNFLMAKTAETLTGLYKDGLIPQAEMALKASMAEYAAGKVEMIALLKNLNTLLDSKLQYHSQIVEKEKAIARIEALVGQGFKEIQK
ncbi:MAG: TolC family protein [Nitrospirae bacterium]|nr:TolC family protein [Nitrospirota bacterium]